MLRLSLVNIVYLHILMPVKLFFGIFQPVSRYKKRQIPVWVFTHSIHRYILILFVIQINQSHMPPSYRRLPIWACLCLRENRTDFFGFYDSVQCNHVSAHSQGCILFSSLLPYLIECPDHDFLQCFIDFVLVPC